MSTQRKLLRSQIEYFYSQFEYFYSQFEDVLNLTAKFEEKLILRTVELILKNKLEWITKCAHQFPT